MLAICLVASSCKKITDIDPESNITTDNYYTSLTEMQAGVYGVYSGLRAPLKNAWQMTELRSDNSWMGVTGSTNSFNRDLSDLDFFIPNTTQNSIFQYWTDVYASIRSCNVVLAKLGVSYDAASGTIKLDDVTLPVSLAERKQLAGEVLFIRAHHYFNLVRLFGGVFLLEKPLTPFAAKSINRSTVAETYKFIETDLTTAASYTSATKFANIPSTMIGKANAWSAKALLAKVYLTQNRKDLAIPVLKDVISNSGYGPQSSYANIFSISNEMNSEIIFAVRYKSGGIGQGSSFGNDFGPLNSAASVINGSGLGWNTPTSELDTLMMGDNRRAVNIAFFGTGTAANPYVKKYLTPVTITNDGESDWPILRYTDVTLMLAEAEGFTAASVATINLVRTRGGVAPVNPLTLAEFEKALSQERRVEFAFENQRWFDLLRFNSTLTTIKAVQVIKDHFAATYVFHYGTYVIPTPTLALLQSYVTTDKLLLPIPQREIDTNTSIVIAQNPGY